MKILYISPENTVGILNTWKQGHIESGHECRYITFYKSKYHYKEDICLNLPYISSHNFYTYNRNLLYTVFNFFQSNSQINIPKVKKENLIESIYFKYRDKLWENNINQAIEKYKLYDFDIYHFEWGLDFFRDCRFVKELVKKNKKIICHYHGEDLRTRGVIEPINSLSHLNLTNEIDLLTLHSKIEYLFLPYNIDNIKPRQKFNDKIRICHATSNRYFKGSEQIISDCNQLANEMNIDFVLIENMAHNEALELKATCDINIDQIGNYGGIGYGMNSIEAMAQGLCCLTEINITANHFLKDHPFININQSNLYSVLKELILNKEKIYLYQKKARAWVESHHSYQHVIQHLYQMYKNYKII